MEPLGFLVWVVNSVLVGATVLAIPVSRWLLNRLRSTVEREMARDGGGTAWPVERDGSAVTAPAGPELAITVVDEQRAPAESPAAAAFFAQVRRRTRATAAVQAVAGAAFAAVMTYGWLVATEDPLRPPTKVAILFWAYYWPTVLAWALVIATDRRGRLSAIGAYTAGWCLLGAWVLGRNPNLTAAELLFYWVFVALPPTLMLGAAMLRRIRTVGPLVLPLLALLLTGAAAAGILLGFGQALGALLIDRVGLLPQDADPVFWALAGSAVCLPPFFGWRRLVNTADRYERRRLSDEGIQFEAIFLFFAVVQSISLVRETPLAIVSGIFALVAHRGVIAVGMKLAARPRATERPVRLLLLRVFALGRRSERLFDALQRIWLRQGGIAMIAGSDLAASTVEPHEFVQFVLGRLRQQFVGDAHRLEERFRTLDTSALPDGRYRVDGFYCHTNAWQPVLRRLVHDCDVVLMDLRSFATSNQGCVYELGYLIDGIDLRRVLFLIDDATDHAFLERTLQELWARCHGNSPNRANPAPTATIYRCTESPERDLRPLLRHLLARSALHAPEPVG